MADLTNPRVRFELSLEARAALPVPQHEVMAWAELAARQHAYESALLALYDQAIEEEREGLAEGEELDPELLSWRQYQARRVEQANLFKQSAGIGFKSSMI